MSDYKVIIIDDDQYYLNSMKIALKPLKLNIFTESNPIKALNMIRSHDYNLIVTDLRMPGMNGLELIIQIRKVRCDAKIIVVSAFYNLEITMYKITSFVDAVFVKPINFNNFIETIKSYLKEYIKKYKK